MRKLGLVSSLWAALLLFPLTVLALGLGEIEVDSFLNQPLKAEIEVISARPGEIDDLLISLASRDAFRKAGLERPAVLSKLKFKVNKSEDGQSATISVSTKTPVIEPFLSFLVEADWAKGRLLREFTVLLDPPSFAQQAVTMTPEPQASSVSVTQPLPVERTVSTPKESVQSVSRPIATAEPVTNTSQQQQSMDSAGPVSAMGAETSPEQIVVEKGDTLWGIASQLKDADHSMAQVMLALQMMNPEAFGQDNINNLKVGSVLRVPEMNSLDSLSKQEAYAQVLEQNGLWDEYVARKSGATSTASPTSASAGVSSAQTDEPNQLSLLTPGEGDSENASLQNEAGGEDDASRIRKQLALAEEELEAARLENEDLSSRVQSLEEQLSKFEELQKMVQIQDGTLAQLQNSTAEKVIAEAEQLDTETDMSETGAADVIEPVDAMAAETDVSEQTPEAEASDQAPSEVMVEAADEMMAQQDTAAVGNEETMLPVEGQDAPLDEVSGQSTEAETVLPTVSEDVAIDDEQTATVPAPAIITETPGSSFDGGIMDMIPSLDDLLNDPVMLGGLGGVLALVLGFILLRKRKTGEDADGGITIEEPEGINLDDDATPVHVPDVDDTVNVEAEGGDETDIETAILDTEQHMAETLVTDGGEEKEDDEDEFAKTAIVSADELAQTEEFQALPEEQDDVLNEVDVYLAYGLYDNAEDLLNQSLENAPERADYRAKLLDTYFATKNKDAFVKEAEMLKSLGGAADRFWDRVQVMGFELAPENDLFSGAKDSSVSVDELEFAKPETPDFDISAEEESTDFSSTDFNIGEEEINISDTQVLDSATSMDNEFSSTQSLDDLNVDFPDLDEVLDAKAEQMDETADTGQSESDEDLSEADIDLDFNADLDLGIEKEEGGTEITEADLEGLSVEDDDDSDEQAEEEISLDLSELDKDLEITDESSSLGESDDEMEIDLEEPLSGSDETSEEPSIAETVVIAPGEPEAENEQEISEEVELALDEGLDFDMSDMDGNELDEGDFSPSETVALGEINISDDDITEFRPAETDLDFDSSSAETEDELVHAEVDATSGLDKTGTFAPGDFNDEEVKASESEAAPVEEDEIDDLEDLTDIDDIEDLMLPDDVDEVATKLDLAKAFIDMGDAEGARSSLEEVMSEGSEEQKAEATGLLEQIK